MSQRSELRENRTTPKIKICGITTVEDAGYLNRLGIDYAGFVLYKKSKRYVTEQKVKEIFNKLNKDIIKTAVAVSPTMEEVNRIKEMGFQLLQIHGSLKPEILDQAVISIWYAVNISDQEELQKKLIFLQKLPENHREKITGLVMDGAEYGSGVPFRWQGSESLQKQLGEWMEQRKLILAGGLCTENVREGIRVFQPDVVDVSSGVEADEYQNGIRGKSFSKLKDFTGKVRENHE